MGFFSSIGNALGSIASIGSSIGSFLDPISGLISGGLSYMGQQSANSANAAQAGYNRNFQAMMRATQYQTAVKDLQAAGLNPMLAYQNGGAGNVSGAVAAPYQNALGQGISSALQAHKNVAEVRNLDEQNKLIPAQVQQTEDSARYLRQQTLTEVAREFRENQAANIDREKLEIDRFLAYSLARLQLSQARNYDANSALAAIRTQLEGYDVSGKRIDDWARKTDIGGYGRAIGTFFGDLGRVTNVFRR